MVQLSEILQNFRNLQELSLKDNQINSLYGLERCENLVQLDLRENPLNISEILIVLENLQHLKSLYINEEFE